MKKYNTRLETEIQVIFEDEDKAFDYFCSGDWGNYFWELCDLFEVADSLSSAFHNNPMYWSGDCFQKNIEGFGTFYKVGHDKWENRGTDIQEFGKITIEVIQELEPV